MQSAFEYKNSKDQVYYLNSKQVTLKNHRTQVIYFFSRDIRPETALAEVPEGYTVVETSRTKMPVLKRV